MGLALCLIGSNLGGLLGQKMFDGSVKVGMVASMGCCVGAGVVVCVLVGVYYVWFSGRNGGEGGSGRVSDM